MKLKESTVETENNKILEKLKNNKTKLYEFEGYGFKQDNKYNLYLTDFLDRIEIIDGDFDIENLFFVLEKDNNLFYNKLKDNFKFCKKYKLNYNLIIFKQINENFNIWKIDLINLKKEKKEFIFYETVENFVENYLKLISDGNKKEVINKKFPFFDMKIRESGFRWPGNCDGIVETENNIYVLELQKVSNSNLSFNFQKLAYDRLFKDKNEKAIISKQWNAIITLSKKLNAII